MSDLQAAASTLRAVEAAERNRLYDELGIEMTYDPPGRTVRVVGRACSHRACRRTDSRLTYMDVTLPLVE